MTRHAPRHLRWADGRQELCSGLQRAVARVREVFPAAVIGQSRTAGIGPAVVWCWRDALEKAEARSPIATIWS